MENDARSVAALLRKKAEKLLKNMPQKKGSHYKESEIMKLLDELEVYSVGLELQNEALKRSGVYESESREDTKFSEAIKQRIIHEFEVHQIELEMQNAELEMSRNVSPGNCRAIYRFI